MDAIAVRARLPVWAVVKRSYAYVWERRTLLAVPLLLVFAAQCAGGLYIRAIMPADAAAHLDFSWIGPVYAVAFALLVFSISAIVGIHRTVLLDEIRPGLRFLRWDTNLLRYIGTWLLLLLIAFLLTVILALLAGIVAIAAGARAAGGAAPNPGLHVVIVAGIAIALGFVFLRFMLALPAAALGEKDRLGVSWKATRGNVLRLVAVVVLTFLPFAVVSGLLATPTIHHVRMAMRGVIEAQTKAPVAMIFISSIVKSVDLAVLTVMLSLSYDVLVRGGGPAAHRAEPAV